jgi:hypothetical protein
MTRFLVCLRAVINMTDFCNGRVIRKIDNRLLEWHGVTRNMTLLEWHRTVRNVTTDFWSGTEPFQTWQTSGVAQSHYECGDSLLICHRIVLNVMTYLWSALEPLWMWWQTSGVPQSCSECYGDTEFLASLSTQSNQHNTSEFFKN